MLSESDSGLAEARSTRTSDRSPFTLIERPDLVFFRRRFKIREDPAAIVRPRTP
jgi:hypothetical protein